MPLLGSYLGPELVSEGRNLVLFGKTGRGKTHLAVAIAYKAIQNGFSARFTTAAELIEDLSSASTDGCPRRGRGRLPPVRPQRRKRPVPRRERPPHPTPADDFTTNKSPFTEWGDVLRDHDLADTIVDRVLERGRLLVLDGPSYRTRHLPVDELTSSSPAPPPSSSTAASSPGRSRSRRSPRSRNAIAREPADRVLLDVALEGEVVGEIRDWPPEVTLAGPRGPFRIDAFEASVVDGIARSVPGVEPARGVIWYEADAACRAAGERLCAEDEWLTACTGTVPLDEDGDGVFSDDPVRGRAHP